VFNNIRHLKFYNLEKGLAQANVDFESLETLEISFSDWIIEIGAWNSSGSLQSVTLRGCNRLT
jgi:hypothetical protein